MTLRADHVAGAAFIVFGLLVLALSDDLPTGQLSMPGSGFLPKIIATMTIIFGAALALRARESVPYSDLDWGDGKHAALVTVITAAAVYLYTWLGFIITMVLLMMALLLVVERRNPVRAGIYSAAVVLFTYVCFAWLLKTPLPEYGY